MQVPLEITYRDVEKTDDIDQLVREKAAKLDELFENLIACRVAIERPQKTQRAGSPYRVRIDLTRRLMSWTVAMASRRASRPPRRGRTRGPFWSPRRAA